MSDLVRNPNCWFPHVMAQILSLFQPVLVLAVTSAKTSSATVPPTARLSVLLPSTNHGLRITAKTTVASVQIQVNTFTLFQKHTGFKKVSNKNEGGPRGRAFKSAVS